MIGSDNVGSILNSPELISSFVVNDDTIICEILFTVRITTRMLTVEGSEFHPSQGEDCSSAMNTFV